MMVIHTAQRVVVGAALALGLAGAAPAAASEPSTEVVIQVFVDGRHIPGTQELLLENPADQFVLGAYCKACRDHELSQRAGAFVAEQAKLDPRKRRWWGTFKKVCK